MTVEVDLHLHTQASDGTLSPTQLVNLCAERSLRVIAISDHDSTEGLSEAYMAVQEHPEVEIIPAIELSTDVPGSEIHILGYFIDTDDSVFQQTLKRFREGRYERGRLMVEKLVGLAKMKTWTAKMANSSPEKPLYLFLEEALK